MFQRVQTNFIRKMFRKFLQIFATTITFYSMSLFMSTTHYRTFPPYPIHVLLIITCFQDPPHPSNAPPQEVAREYLEKV